MESDISSEIKETRNSINFPKSLLDKKDSRL